MQQINIKMKRGTFALLRTFVFVALMPMLSMSLVSCEPSDDGPETEVPEGEGSENNGSEKGDEDSTTPDNPKEPVKVAVDLGLSVKWATCNLGAQSPEECGGYYSWGELEEKEVYTEDTYLYYKGNGSYQNIGSNISGNEKYDVACATWGDNWRMPTVDEVKELYEKCTLEHTTVNDIEGLTLTGPNGNSIFLPFAGFKDHTAGNTGVNSRGAGYYWSSSVHEEYDYDAYYIRIGKNYTYNTYYCIEDYYYREFGMPVRPVTQ